MKKKSRGWSNPAPTESEARGIAITLQNKVFERDSLEYMKMWEQIHHVISDREVLKKKLERLKGRKK